MVWKPDLSDYDSCLVTPLQPKAFSRAKEERRSLSTKLSQAYLFFGTGSCLIAAKVVN